MILQDSVINKAWYKSAPDTDLDTVLTLGLFSFWKRMYF